MSWKVSICEFTHVDSSDQLTGGWPNSSWQGDVCEDTTVQHAFLCACKTFDDRFCSWVQSNGDTKTRTRTTATTMWIMSSKEKVTELFPEHFDAQIISSLKVPPLTFPPCCLSVSNSNTHIKPFVIALSKLGRGGIRSKGGFIYCLYFTIIANFGLWWLPRTTACVLQRLEILGTLSRNCFPSWGIVFVVVSCACELPWLYFCD